MQINVLEYLDHTAERLPDKTAFIDEKCSVTFRETAEYMNAIASYLLRRGYCNEGIAVYMSKGVHMITAFFGVIAAGCFYIPIDEEMPSERIAAILENCKTGLMICDGTTIEKASHFSDKIVSVLFDDIVTTDAEAEMLRSVRDNALDTDLIYVVFTSGSTGAPKGVAACHRSVIDYVEQLSETLGFTEDTVFGNQSPLYFDACLKEIYPTIKYGALTYLIPHQLFMFPTRLVEYLNVNRINTICWVASALTMISAFGTFDIVRPEYLSTIAFGSEVFPVKQYKLWKEALPEAGFTNLYGPTECTGMSCYYHIDREFLEDEVIPIGRPFKNTRILLLGDDGKEVDKGSVGEIYIGGTCVTMGYYNNPEKTGEAFVQNPLNTAFKEIVYRTGDMAYRNEYGELVFVSRRDHQIKHMGHRIELGEIEAAVNAEEGVKMGACIYHKELKRIILYYIGEIKESELMVRLKEKLPRYMLPGRLIRMDVIPFTANGKIDRRALYGCYEEFINTKAAGKIQ